jgi:hypothetical protein
MSAPGPEQPNKASRWSVENIARVKARLAAQSPATPMALIRNQRYHPSAAVVTRFSVNPSYHTDREAAQNLVADSLLVDESDGCQYWSLKNDVRKRVLAGLHARSELTRALDQAPERPDNLLQHVLESWIRGEQKPLDQLTAPELSATLQVIDWLETTELESQLPSTDDVRRRVEYAALLQPFRDLVGTHFRGRVRELSVLRDYLADPGTPSAFWRPLLIHGPGGMGKSTLLSKFILDTAANASIAIIYLDCDRPGLVAEEPLTLLAEAVRQLGLQFEHLRGSSLRLRSTWLAELANFHVAASDGLESRPLESVATRDRRNYVQTFALFARELPPSVPVLLAIDTFEELQFRSRDFVNELFEFMSELRAALPQLRIVISGRDELQGFDTERLPLAELDAEAAEGYLAARGIDRPEVRRTLARALRGNPLSLSLAAALVTGGVMSATEVRELERIVDDTQIQGFLYGRILDHLHDTDPELEKIAHPGLILRRITAPLIQHVLATACGLNIDSPERAEELFRRLRSEMALVIPDGDDAVRHRADVRRVMLPALFAAERTRVDAIQHAAIEYYLDREDVASRAEELYHRLMLGQPREEIDRRWTVPGVDALLRNALDDLSGPSRAYLAAKLQIELYDNDLDALEPIVWERTVATRAESLIRLDRPQEALALMRQRAWRSPGSSLYWLEARLLRQLGRSREARQIARAGIASLEGRRPSPEHLDVYILSAEMDEVIGGDIDWDRASAHYHQLADANPQEPRVVRYALPYLRLAARTGNRSTAVDALTHDAVLTLSGMSRQQAAQLVQELPPLPAFDPFRTKPADPPTSSGTSLRESYAVAPSPANDLVAALLDALPTMSDLWLLVARLDEKLDRLASPTASLKEATHAVVEWAERKGRTGDLVSTAAALNPKASGLQHLLSHQGTRVATQDANPFEAVLLPGGRPFLNRNVLRQFMMGLLSPTPVSRVLSITGPSGCGKSYSREYVSYLASATGAFEPGYFDVSPVMTAEDLVGAIHSAFRWRWDERNDEPSEHTGRRAAQYANQVVNKGRRSKRITLIFLDLESGPLHASVVEFVLQLSQQVAQFTAPLAVIAVGFDNVLPPDLCQVESLVPLSKDDLVSGLRQLAPGTDAALIDQTATEILARVPPDTPQFNAQLNRLAASYAASLLDAIAPVRLFISYASQDENALNSVLDIVERLRREGLVQPWSTRDLQAGMEWRSEIAKQLSLAEIVLLVGTKNYVRLKQWESLNVPQLQARQARGEVRVLVARLDSETDAGALETMFPTADLDSLTAALTDAASAIRRRRVQRTGSGR